MKPYFSQLHFTLMHAIRKAKYSIYSVIFGLLAGVGGYVLYTIASN